MSWFVCSKSKQGPDGVFDVQVACGQRGKRAEKGGASSGQMILKFKFVHTSTHTCVENTFAKNHEHNISSYSIALATLFEDIVHCHLDLEAPRDDRWMHLDLETKLDGRK